MLGLGLVLNCVGCFLWCVVRFFWMLGLLNLMNFSLSDVLKVGLNM